MTGYLHSCLNKFSAPGLRVVRPDSFGLLLKNRFCCCCFRGLSENSNSNIYQEFDGVIGGGLESPRLGGGTCLTFPRHEIETVIQKTLLFVIREFFVYKFCYYLHITQKVDRPRMCVCMILCILPLILLIRSGNLNYISKF